MYITSRQFTARHFVLFSHFVVFKSLYQGIQHYIWCLYVIIIIKNSQ